MNALHQRLTRTAFACAALALGLSATTAWSQTAPAAAGKAAIEAAYQRDRAACQSIAAPPDRSNCLRDAGAARAQALRSGDRGAPSSDQLQRNALQRCQQHPGDRERETCERMVRGDGQATGSVQGGGIIRELVTQEPVPPPPLGVPGTLPPLQPGADPVMPAVPLPSPVAPQPGAPLPR